MSHCLNFNYKNSDIFTQIKQISPYQTPLAARFRDTYTPTFRKYVYTESKTNSFQQLNNKIFRSHCPNSNFQRH